MRTRWIYLCAVIAATAAGCAERPVAEGDQTRPSALPDRSPVAGPEPAEDPELEDDAGPSPAEWTVGIVRRDRPPTGVAVQTDLRVARNEGFDRVVLEFGEDEMPSYQVEYVDRPVRQCGSGDVVPVEGDGWLAVRLQPAHAHDEDGRATITDRSLRPDLPVLKQVTIICDFEAHVEWILGVGSPNRFRVMELLEPTRLVVDVRH